MHLTWNLTVCLSFIEYLESLPNLHSLGIGRVGYSMKTLKDALKGVELPEMKALVIPNPTAQVLQYP